MGEHITDLWITDDVSMITVENMPNTIASIAKVFGALGQAGINIDMISYVPSQRDKCKVSFTISGRDFAKTLKILGDFQRILGDDATRVNSGNVKLTVSGEPMRDRPGVAASVFEVLAENSVEVKLITTSETEISFLVDEKDSDKAIGALKERFNV